MRSVRPLIVAVVGALAAATAPAGANDHVNALYEQAEQFAYNAVEFTDRFRDSLPYVTPPPPPPPPPTISRTLDYFTDSVTIKDAGAGPFVETAGVFDNPGLWTCQLSASTGQPVRYTCVAVPTSGYTWQCGVMHVSATAESRPIDVVNWAEEWLTSAQSGSRRAPNLPDPSRLQWGRVSALASCDGSTVMTEQANQQTPYRDAAETLGPVSTFVCEARLSPTQATAPVRPYTVNCVDPPAPPRS